MTEWSVTEPTKLAPAEPVTRLRVRVVNGAVNVVGTEESSARVEISEIEGPPLIVSQEGSTLTVGYEDLQWKSILKWLDHKEFRRRVVVSVAVPAGTDVEVGVVGAEAVVTGIRGRTEVRGVTGDTTLLGLSGPVRAESVSGSLEAQSVTGALRVNSVTGDVTVIEGSGASVKAETVSGDMVIDLDPADLDGPPADIRLASVSGEVAIRLPHPADARVEASTTSGSVSTAFEDLRVGGQWGTKSVTGTLGSGRGTLKATTVSGSIALLRRPEPDGDTGSAPSPSASGKVL
ncbi:MULTISPECIES: DUF4097 family beta strand repeat-containing protein [unclassified Streptomyces]|uniref:DUF4097 family beta strand repeat-containing protein n=1 Tax=unclassified Streptomyces TaxID=2593676 RepID=UPI0016618702|nr:MULTISPECIES: DUF4097 family beta strand repeat-containing protein [unclassified Streptomyces]MBD0707348.1 hypothetical protein [Streptomyces sp. CBMA291]MBD0715200.1 hypothetical protein [Streptomyces sp. CBMA370]